MRTLGISLRLALAGVASDSATRADVEAVAESGAQAPGEAGGVTFRADFLLPVIGGGGIDGPGS